MTVIKPVTKPQNVSKFRTVNTTISLLNNKIIKRIGPQARRTLLAPMCLPGVNKRCAIKKNVIDITP